MIALILSCRQRLLTAEADRDKLRAAVLQAQAQADELIAALKGLAADRDAARAAAADARSEADRLQTALAKRPPPAAAPAPPPAQVLPNVKRFDCHCEMVLYRDILKANHARCSFHTFSSLCRRQ